MRHAPRSHERILAIDPISRGFGYVVLETSEVRLLDWGVAECGRTRAGVGAALGLLARRYEPSVLVLEEPEDGRTAARRAALASMRTQVVETAVGRWPTRFLRRTAVHCLHRQLGAVDKNQLIQTLIKRFPELAAKAPPKRQLWQSEDARYAIFDALALAFGWALTAPSLSSQSNDGMQ